MNGAVLAQKALKGTKKTNDEVLLICPPGNSIFGVDDGKVWIDNYLDSPAT